MYTVHWVTVKQCAQTALGQDATDLPLQSQGVTIIEMFVNGVKVIALIHVTGWMKHLIVVIMQHHLIVALIIKLNINKSHGINHQDIYLKSAIITKYIIS